MSGSGLERVRRAGGNADRERLAAARPQVHTVPHDETTDVGCDTGAPVSPDYRAGDNAFTGTINWVRVDTGDASMTT